MKKLTPFALFALAAGAAAAAWLYYDHRRAMARERGRLARTDDATLQALLERTLPLIARPSELQVTVHDGVATLRGELDRVRRDRVLRAALAAPGVKSVVNRLELTGPAPMPDEIPGLPAN